MSYASCFCLDRSNEIRKNLNRQTVLHLQGYFPERRQLSRQTAHCCNKPSCRWAQLDIYLGLGRRYLYVFQASTVNMLLMCFVRSYNGFMGCQTNRSQKLFLVEKNWSKTYIWNMIILFLYSSLTHFCSWLMFSFAIARPWRTQRRDRAVQESGGYVQRVGHYFSDQNE